MGKKWHVAFTVSQPLIWSHVTKREQCKLITRNEIELCFGQMGENRHTPPKLPTRPFSPWQRWHRALLCCCCFFFFYGCECIYMQLLCQCKVGNTVSLWYFLRQLDFCKACTVFSVCRRAQQREVSVKKIKKSHREWKLFVIIQIKRDKAQHPSVSVLLIHLSVWSMSLSSVAQS